MLEFETFVYHEEWVHTFENDPESDVIKIVTISGFLFGWQLFPKFTVKNKHHHVSITPLNNIIRKNHSNQNYRQNNQQKGEIGF